MLYNILFPVWMLVWFPTWLWLLLIPGNYLLDRIVLWCSLNGVERRSDICRAHTWKICLAGFAADLAGSVLLLVSMLFFDSLGMDWANDVSYALGFNVFSQPIALLVTLLAVALSAGIIYRLNRLILRRAGLDEPFLHKAALTLAIATAPYLFLFPSILLY